MLPKQCCVHTHSVSFARHLQPDAHCIFLKNFHFKTFRIRGEGLQIFIFSPSKTDPSSFTDKKIKAIQVARKGLDQIAASHTTGSCKAAGAFSPGLDDIVHISDTSLKLPI